MIIIIIIIFIIIIINIMIFHRIGLGALPPSSDPKVTKVRSCVGKVSSSVRSGVRGPQQIHSVN